MPILFRTEDFSARITKHEALLIAPKFAIFKVPNGKRKDRLETKYHRYHESFHEAKNYLLAVWRAKVKTARNHLEFLEQEQQNIERTEEKDL